MSGILEPRPAEGCWLGMDNGVEFVVRPADGIVAGPTLVELSRYQITATLPDSLASPRLVVGGLALSQSNVWKHAGQMGCTLSLSSEFGQLEISLHDGAHPYATCRIQVHPRHLDLDTDFAAIRSDLERISYSLAYALWKQTFHELYPHATIPAGIPEWLGLLRSLWERLALTIREIERDPDRQVVQRQEQRDAARATRMDPGGLRWLTRHPEAWERHTTQPRGFSHPLPGGGFAAPRKVLVTHNDVSYDTTANRALKAALRDLERRLVYVINAVQRLSKEHFASAQKTEYKQQLERIRGALRSLLMARYLSEVRDVKTAHPRSVHVIRTDPRYRETLRALDVLKWGLVSEMSGRAVRMALKDTWQLYEYWVFMYVLDLLRTRGWEEVEQDVVTTDLRGELIVSLQHDDTHAHFKREDADTGEVSEVVVTFHKGFAPKGTCNVPALGALTVKRDVDIMLTVNRENGFHRYVLDPKYRVEVTSNGCRVCPTSAIDDMHVYRDAIGRWAPRPGGGLYFERILQGAFAIFPSRDEECYRKHLFAQRIEDGIGAVPLLPSEPPLEMFADLVDRLCS